MLSSQGGCRASWRFSLVRGGPINIVVLQLTVCFVCIAAAASVKPPGDTTPDINIEIGSSANITCRIVTGGNSSSIWFTENNTVTKEATNITQPSNQIFLLDAQTAILTIRNASEYKGHYQCMSGKNAIGRTKVNVGNRPAEVTDFSCKTYHFNFMTCTFTKPNNMIYTSYELNYKPNEYNQNYQYNCILQIINVTYICNITQDSDPVYIATRQNYYFNLTGINELGTHSQKFTIANYRSVIPAKLDIKIEAITSNSVEFGWTLEKYVAYYIEEGLQFRIRLKPNGYDWYNVTDLVHRQCSSGHCIVLTTLQYPYCDYKLEVSVKVATASSDPDMWSEPFIGEFATKARRPDGPPKTAVGSFSFDSKETELKLYWQKMEDYEKNGPDFYYAINQTDLEGKTIDTKRTNNTSVTFAWRPGMQYNYHIKACNSMGQSLESSQIQVVPMKNLQFVPHTIVAVYHNRSYTLSWKAPNKQSSLINYTVFWCISKMELPNECRDSIYFKYLDKHVTNFTTEPQDHTLNLAVSANYLDTFTGMQWALCSSDVSRELIKLEPSAEAASSTEIRVRWGSGSICASILKGYNLTYCEVTYSSTTESSTSTITTSTDHSPTCVKVFALQGNEYIIKNLKPYTNYSISMLMYSNSKVGPNSDLLYVRTKESAPTKPRNLTLNINSITSNSANISWMPPLVTNGELKYYTIWKLKNGTKDHQIVYINATNEANDTQQPIVFNLNRLNSYAKYEVYITAHTVESSDPSNSIQINTMIGRPTNPRNVTLKKNDNGYVLRWMPPEMPSGRVDFYVVAVVVKHKDEEHEKITLINKRECEFELPQCITYFLRVYAVNVANRNEIDYITFSDGGQTNPEIDSTVASGLQSYNTPLPPTQFSDGDSGHRASLLIKQQQQDTTKAIFTSTNSKVFRDGTMDNFNDFKCSNANPIDHKYFKYLTDGRIGGDEFKLLLSTSEEANKQYYCTEVPWEQFLLTTLYIIASTTIIAYCFYRLRKKYNNMKNINVVLPEELIDHKPYHLGSDVSRSNDCLVSQKENTTLLATLCTLPLSGIKSLTHANNILELDGAPPKNASVSAHVDQEENSSQSTNSVEMNEISASSKCSTPSIHHTQEVELPTSYQKMDELVAKSAAPLLLANGYVPHEVMMLPPQQSAFDGYTTLDAMGKTVAPSFAAACGQQHQAAASTSKPLSAAVAPSAVSSSSFCMDNKGSSDAQYVSHDFAPVVVAAQNNHNNNNNSLICGYVTQRQLAEFGQHLN